MVVNYDFSIKVKFARKHVIFLLVSLFFIIIDFLLMRGTYIFGPVIIIAVSIGWMPYWLDFFAELRKQKAIEQYFPEFVRNLIGAIKS